MPNSLNIRNPFRQDMMARQFDALVNCYVNQHRDLIRDGFRNLGNSWATGFWRGYDDVIPSERWDRGSKQTFAWACYRAGKAVRALEGDNPKYPPETSIRRHIVTGAPQ